MTSKLTVQQIDAIRAKVAATTDIPSGIGDEENACTIAMINLAISGKLTDDIPPCMSEVIGKAAIALQDAMPDDMRNSQRYRDLVPRMAGTGRDLEKERLAVLLEWMWGTVLPEGQPLADRLGFGSEWRAMTTERTAEAAVKARTSASAAKRTEAEWAEAAEATAAAEWAEDWAEEWAAAEWAEAEWAKWAMAAAEAASWMVSATKEDAYAHDLWHRLDPIGLLERMVEVSR